VAQNISFGNAISITNQGRVAVTLQSSIPANYTISTWLYLAAGTAGAEPGSAILSSECGSTVEFLLRGSSSTSPQYLELGRCNGFYGIQSSGSIPVGAWTHVAVTVDVSKTVRYYINGQAAGSWDASFFNLGIGPVFAIGENAYRRFNGIIDEFQIWTNALPQSQIQTNMFRTPGSGDPGLFLYYSFDSTTGTTATNSAAATSGFYDGYLDLVGGSPAWVESGAPPLPTSYTSNATSEAATGATLNGGVNPNGFSAAAWFEWGTSQAYGNYTATNNVPAGYGVSAQSAALSGLVPGTVYHYRMAAANGAGISYGSNQIVAVGFVTVTNYADSGPGTLRDAIAKVPAGGVINFTANGVISLTTSGLQISKDLTIQGLGATNLSISGANGRRVLHITGGNVNISGVTIRNGRASSGSDSFTAGVPGGGGAVGGGILNAGTLRLTNCIVTGNAAGAGGNGYPPLNTAGVATDGGSGGSGGGIYNTGHLIIHGCTVHGNSAGAGGFGGFGNFATNRGAMGGLGGLGGGLYHASGSALIVLSTFSGNSAGNGGGGGNGGSGQGGNPGGNAGDGGNGGNGGAIGADAPFEVKSVTISGNAAGSGGNGGFAAFGFGGGSGGVGGNGGGISTRDTFSAESSIIAANNAATSPDVQGSVWSGGYNLVGRNQSSINFFALDRFGTIAAPLNPLLGPLQFNGGPTPTMALLAGSPAIERGKPESTPTDQRGFPRVSGSFPDAGAFELDISGFPPLSLTAASASIGAPSDPLGLLPVDFQATVNPGGLETTMTLEYGLSSAFGGVFSSGLSSYPLSPIGFGVTLPNFAPGTRYFYRMTASNAREMVSSSTLSFITPARYPLGDENGDGIVDAAEVNTVLSNYIPSSPWLQMTNVAGLGQTDIMFSLTNEIAGVLGVEVSTNLVDWTNLGPAVPRYLFQDTNAPAAPQRHYRLRWPNN
jgi:hypothetical protein